jgi:PAS domain S-box-containing protein
MLNLYSRALECTTNGVVISDMTLPGHPVFYANPAFYRITGYDPGEAIGRNCAFLQRDDTDQPELDVLRQAIRAARVGHRGAAQLPQGRQLFFNELADRARDRARRRVQHYVGILNDVTERERTRLAIAERSARLNAVFDLSPDGFVVFDRRGLLVYTNRAFNEMTGLGWTRRRGGDHGRLRPAFPRCARPVPCRPRWPRRCPTDDGDGPETLHLCAPSAACWRAWCAAGRRRRASPSCTSATSRARPRSTA